MKEMKEMRKAQAIVLRKAIKLAVTLESRSALRYAFELDMEWVSRKVLKSVLLGSVRVQ